MTFYCFCLLGSRFNYTVYDKSCGPIYKSIEALDRKVIYDLKEAITVLQLLLWSYHLSVSLSYLDVLSTELQ